MDNLNQLTKDILVCQPEKHHGLWKGGRKVAQHRWNIKESSKKMKADYYQRHREERLQAAKERELRRKKEVLTYYGGGVCACVQCGENNILCLSIDHIEGGGRQHRLSIGVGSGNKFYYWLMKQQFPSGYQTLCMNCQFKKLALEQG